MTYRYLAPGLTPPATSPAAAKVMRRTKRRDTLPELKLRRALHRRGLRFLVDRSPPGTNRRRRADILLRGARIAVFVDGCFGH
ncbi:very short patch repair endonuclease, partial [Klebsiella pneumoniae]|nr:very short patch repair endonuclease [Klebsiella pneumoniae]